ncbi:hypothetical protein DEO72_LG11g1634 [Vigna unguiculata]|uniref:Uncharacterized protein n=1 Tax=Vigna unguiculata TaxID=3917 RepID=A0A4D6NNW4_VIGUN|nr:hypothetical protein DEO72_LG11g1634 [Vigna unguiculata]
MHGGRESEGGFEAGAVVTELRREARDLWWCCGASAGDGGSFLCCCCAVVREDGGAVVVRVRCENGADSGEECGREVVAPWCAGWMRVTADWWCSGGRRGEEVRRRLPWWWKERRKLGLGFWEMKMMTWQPSIGQLVSARIVATWLALVG